MKLFQKQFLTMICFILVAFTVFGTVMVHNSFRMTLDKEIERNLEEIKMFQYALLSSIEGLPSDYHARDRAVVEIATSIEEGLKDNKTILFIFNEKQEKIYENKPYKEGLISLNRKGKSGIWRIKIQGMERYLESLWEVNTSFGTYYLEMNRNINYVYEQRATLYHNYQIAIVVVFAIFALLSFFISLSFTAPIAKLSQATREFAQGDLKRRVKVKGTDEVSMLMEDFNQMAQQLEKNMKEMEEYARRKEEFSESFAHELKTPLTSIIGYADMLRSMELSKEDAILSADYIFKQGKRLERLAYKMMELSYVDRQKIKFSEIFVPELMEEVARMNQEAIEKKSITLELDMEDGIILGDRDLLVSLFSNLIDNARKAVEEGGQILVSGRKLEHQYEVTVKDNGYGMKEEELSKITEAFYMVDKSRARKEGGAGMGMTLCEKIIKLHEANWKIESEVLKGTKVTVWFQNQEEQTEK